MNTSGLKRWIAERYSIYQKRERGLPPPWTRDPILSTYRFCNVHRENDKETRWIFQNWLKPHSKDPHIWFAAMVARFINWHPSLEAIGYPITWTPNRMRKILTDRKHKGEKVFTGAYIVSTNGLPMGKIDYVIDEVLTPAWEFRSSVSSELTTGISLSACSEIFTKLYGVNTFMSGQMIADIKFFHAALRKACDWNTWAAPGPGSRRGLNRVMNRAPQTRWKSGEWESAFSLLLEKIQPWADGIALPPLDGQNVQNCLCEFDKYERVRTGEGRPRSKYAPHTED